MKKQLIIHYILMAAGLALTIVAAYLLAKNEGNMLSKLIIVFAGLFVAYSQYLIIKNKK